MNKLILIAVGLLMSSSMAFSESLESYFHLKPVQKAPESVLYIQTSNQATLKPVNANSQNYLLTLSKVNPMVSFFSDRPARVTGQIGNAVYLQTWNQGGKNSFNKDAPNAVVSGVIKVKGQNQSVNIMLALSNPVIDTKHATITYNAKLLSKDQSKLVLEAAHLNFVTLFIDGGVCTTCIIGG